jgi:hypothetical protein
MKYLRLSIKSTSAFIAFALLVSACGEQSVQKSDDLTVVKIDSTKTSIVNVSGKLFSIPSPIQTAILIRDSDAPYQSEVLNSPANAQNYATNTARAINLGVYGTEMAYASLFDDGQSALKYYKVVDDMANELGIKGAIDAGLVARLGSNIGNADSLLILSGNFYKAADTYLKENDRLEIAALVLLGGWVESSYLTALSANAGDAGARTRLAEQKNAVKTLATVLETVAGKEFTKGEIMQSIRELNGLFGEITTTYAFVAPVTNPETKTTKIASKTNYEISDAQVVAITEKLNALRTQIIS